MGKPIYLSCTCPYITYAIGVVSQFMHQPQVDHMDVMWRIIRYIKGTVGPGVWFKANGHLNAKVDTSAYWKGDKETR